uniref:Uncharacterized protein n=1 Tax=Arundo donax TaxID=35708 RepID=A0A0A8ZXN7_ARUDO
MLKDYCLISQNDSPAHMLGISAIAVYGMMMITCMH